jgi:zinc protease
VSSRAPSDPGTAGPAAPDLLPWLQRTRCLRLDNGLLLCRLDNPQAPLVTTALFYRAGTRDEPPGHGGLAHFLEHMMFKGSAGFGPGEIDRITQALGGANNAFTSHDLSAYYFSFAADRWERALELEADRMRGLRLDPDEVASERQVILEEIDMYADEPWDALELAVLAALFDGHPYGRPVLGTAGELAALGGEELAAFHRRFYGPDNAVLVVAGELDGDAEERVARTFGELPARSAARPKVGAAIPPSAMLRLERRQGETARLLLALPAPGADDDDHARLRLLAAILGSGRASRLQRRLVEEGHLCLGVNVNLAESAGDGFLAIAAEVLPGVEPPRVEAALLGELARLREAPPAPEEIARARQVLLADWAIGHERIHQQALTVGAALALFDIRHPERSLAATLACGAEPLHAVARRRLDPERGAVLGWSLP